MFTAGVGENDKGMRERILNGLDYLGVEVDFELNRNCPRGENVEISKPDSKVKVFVIPTDEELMIAKDTARSRKIRRRMRGLGRRSALYFEFMQKTVDNTAPDI